jgi:hypothetical protein
MSDDKIMNDPRYMALPPLRMVLGEMPQTGLKSQAKPTHLPPLQKQELVIPVKRLIAHLEENLN